VADNTEWQIFTVMIPVSRPTKGKVRSLKSVLFIHVSSIYVVIAVLIKF